MQRKGTQAEEMERRFSLLSGKAADFAGVATHALENPGFMEQLPSDLGEKAQNWGEDGSRKREFWGVVLHALYKSSLLALDLPLVVKTGKTKVVFPSLVLVDCGGGPELAIFTVCDRKRVAKAIQPTGLLVELRSDKKGDGTWHENQTFLAPASAIRPIGEAIEFATKNGWVVVDLGEEQSYLVNSKLKMAGGIDGKAIEVPTPLGYTFLLPKLVNYIFAGETNTQKALSRAKSIGVSKEMAIEVAVHALGD